MGDANASGIALPQLPGLDQDDLKAIRGFLPGKLVGRTAALLSLIVLLVGVVAALTTGLKELLGGELPVGSWVYYLVLIGIPALIVALQLGIEWNSARTQRAARALAVETGVEQAGYFRIGPYQDSAGDRTSFDRADRAHQNVLDWVERSTAGVLYLTGDSGTGKSSLLKAFVLPALRDRGWVVLETRAWQDPVAAVHSALVQLGSPAPQQASFKALMDLARGPSGMKLLIVLDQFEEFVIVGTPEKQKEFAELLATLRADPPEATKLLLALRSDYQVFLEDLGLPPLRQGENFCQIPRFTLAAATTFMKRSGLNLQDEALKQLLISAARLDETPGLVRPITLNVVGHVLSGNQTAPSLDAGEIIRHYINQTIQQPAIREIAPTVLEHLITEQSTKQTRSEQDLMSATHLRRGEVRAVLNALASAALARPLDAEQCQWELSHDFVARSMARYLGRARSNVIRRIIAYAAPGLLALMLAVAGGIVIVDHMFAPLFLKIQLNDIGLPIKGIGSGYFIEANSQVESKDIVVAVDLVKKLEKLTAPELVQLDLQDTAVRDLEPVKGFSSLETLKLSNTFVYELKPLSDLTKLKQLFLDGTRVQDLSALRGLAKLEWIDIGDTRVQDLDPLKDLPSLTVVDGARNATAAERASVDQYRASRKLPKITWLRLSAN